MVAERQICEQITYTYDKCLFNKFLVICIEGNNSFNLNPGGTI